MAILAKPIAGCRHDDHEHFATRAPQAFVDEQVARGVYGSTSEYVRDLIRRDHERSRLRDVLLDGAESAVNVDVDDAFFAELRDRARQSADG